MKPRTIAIAAFSCLFLSQAWGAVYIARHAEKVVTKKTDDPPLKRTGRKRAQDLARALRSTALKAIYVTEFQRTKETAAPTAREFGLTPIQVKSEETAALARRIKSEHRDDDVLVVAHSDTIGDLLDSLGVKKSVKIENADYDNLFVVDLDSDSARLHWLHYGD